MKKFLITLTFFFVIATLQADDEFCGIRNVSFQTGEVINFNVYYSVGPVYVNAGSASFTASMAKVNNKPVYHVVGEGHTQ